MSDKERSGGHSAKPPAKPPHNPGRNLHPNATVKHQAGEKHDPTRAGGGKGGKGR